MKKTIILMSLIVLSLSSQAQAYKYYAGFIFNFTKNMNWDSGKQSGDFIIAVVGDSPVIPFLEEMALARTVGTQKIIIKKVTNAQAAAGSHLIFLPSAQSSQLANAVSVANTSKALLVTEKAGLGTKGSALNFIETDGKLGFEINKKALNSANIQINSKLESLGKIVG